MRTVHLGGKRAAGRVALVSDEDYGLVAAIGWQLREGQRGGKPWGPYATGNIFRGGRRRTIFMHNLIMGRLEIDHINGYGLDNQRHNLRPATRTQNMQNRKPNQGHSSAFKGVGWHKAVKKWTANITVNGKRRYLGCFTSEIEAALAYDRVARAEFGAFARPNFPDVAA